MSDFLIGHQRYCKYCGSEYWSSEGPECTCYQEIELRNIKTKIVENIQDLRKEHLYEMLSYILGEERIDELIEEMKEDVIETEDLEIIEKLDNFLERLKN